MKTAVVILNWNTREYLRRWLPSLLSGDADVWVADNASADGSLEMVRESFPEVRTIGFDDNYGFTGGYNRAIDAVSKAADYRYAVLLNSDVDVQKGWLEPLEEWMDSHPECGICGPKILAMDPSGERTGRFEYAGGAGGYLDRFGYPFCRGRVMKRTELDEGQYDTPREVMWISGACLMTRMSLWRDLGGLDDRFFAHMEEIDYCWRAQLAGWKVTEVPYSSVWHLGGGTLPQDSPFKLKLNFRNNLLLLDNNLEATIHASGGRSWRAKCRITFRRMLDIISAAVYLIKGRKDLAGAVADAHREFKGLREMPRRTAVHPEQGAVPAGLLDLCIVPLAALKGNRIFKYLRQYENSH